MFKIEDLTMENWPSFEALLIRSEEAFPEQIRSSSEDFTEVLRDGEFIAKVAVSDAGYIGNIIGYGMDRNEFEKYNVSGISGKRTLYLFNFVVDGTYSRKGYGLVLLSELIRSAKNMGYEQIIGHFRPNGSLALIRKLGGREIGVFSNWENTGEDYILCMLDLGNAQPIPVKKENA